MTDVPKKGDRPPVPDVPTEVLRVLAELSHPSRLPILMALEQRPRTFRELCEDLEHLELKPDAIQYALRRFKHVGLVIVVEDRSTFKKLGSPVYGIRRKGWPRVLKSVAAVAPSDEPPS